MKITYPEALPLTAHLEEIRQALATNQVVVVCGSTGSGKTTQLPKIALEMGFSHVGCTQPRRLAATAMAKRLAAELEVELGEEVGYQVRFDNCSGENTCIKFMTDGILLAETRTDRLLKAYDVLIIDEVHERSLNIDFILGYLKNLLPKRPDLKVIISSATLDTEHFSEFFHHAPIVTVEGRTYPVMDHFLPPEEDEELSDLIGRAVEFIGELDQDGDILIFLPGEREIREATDLLTGRRYPNTEVLPLFARLSLNEQHKIFSPGKKRRIILATNVAETSVTIPRIHYVIDSGLARISRYNARTQIQELQIEQISQASARQRRGRCGRIGEGICVYLYSESTLKRADEYTAPEIRRTSLAGVILQMAMLKLPKITHFPFLDPPPGNLIREGVRTLTDLKAITPSGKLTQDGWILAGLPIDPHLGKMLLTAEQEKVLAEVMIIVAYLSIMDPKERPLDQQQAADDAHRAWKSETSDFMGILKLWNALQKEFVNGRSNSILRKFCRKNFLNFNRTSEWLNLVSDLAEQANNVKWNCDRNFTGKILENVPEEKVHLAILSGIPRNIGMYDREYGYYHGTGGKKFQIFPGSGLFRKKSPPPDWLMSFALVETSRVFARQNAIISPQLVEQAVPHLCVPVYSQVAYDPESGFVYAREQLTFGGLLIHSGRRVHYGKLHPVEAREIFIRDGLATGNYISRFPFLKQHQQMLTSLKKLEEKIRRPGTVLDTNAIFNFFEEKLPPEICSIQSFEKALQSHPELAKSLTMAPEQAMQWQYRPLRLEDYPDNMTFSGRKFSIRYKFAPGEEDDGALLLVPPAELNLLEIPRLEFGIPGYLQEKVELLLKSLPKVVRQSCAPISGTAETFVELYREDSFPPGEGLLTTLANFITEISNHPIREKDFSTDRLPRYCRLRIAELGANGKINQIHDTPPSIIRRTSQLSNALPLTQQLSTSGWTKWPSGSLPDQLPLPGNSGKTAVAALVDEGQTIGRQLFLNLDEAKDSHQAALIRLFRLEQPGIIKFLKRDFKLPSALRLDFFLGDGDKNYLDDLVDWAILQALGNDTWKLRTEQAWEQALEKGRAQIGLAADACQKNLIAIHEAYAEVDILRKKIALAYPGEEEDLQQQLKFLFRSGFLRTPALLGNYSRYLRGAKLRAGRLNSAPVKDRQKLQDLLPWIERFHAAAMTSPLESSPRLRQFFQVLEEARLAKLAPEVKTLCKCTPEILSKLWDDLKL